MDSKTAQSVFGAVPQSKKRTSKEELPVNYKSTNESLVRKNLMYKQQLAQCTKMIEKLRDENVALRQRNQELVDVTDDQKIEMIVEQRVQNRLAHAAVLNQKLVQFLQQTGLEMNGLFKDIETKPSNLNNRRPPKPEINLDRVEESPIRRIEESMVDDMENDDPVETTSSHLSSAQNLENGTPRKRSDATRGRRSELFQSFNPCAVNDMYSGDASSSGVSSKRVPMLIVPSATPGIAPKRTAPQSASKNRGASVEKFKKPSTPARIARQDESELTDTVKVRRQRSAKMNIKTMKEPSLNAKLRRPGKHDEPMPYIDTFF
ncbi:unnamed protein product [Caenorhabditis sp. 36 PRJEB53466]|nr:unnamed protein product [Caenorhabditis sp. 36 PRJEB53466]